MWPIVLEELKKQGFSFLLLAAAVWYFHSENLDLRKSVNNCNERIIQELFEDRDATNKLIYDNTQTMKELKTIIQNKK